MINVPPRVCLRFLLRNIGQQFLYGTRDQMDILNLTKMSDAAIVMCLTL